MEDNQSGDFVNSNERMMEDELERPGSVGEELLGDAGEDAGMDEGTARGNEGDEGDNQVPEGGEGEDLGKGNQVPMFLLSNGSLSSEFKEDQLRDDNFTDMDIICSDGYIQVHRCLLMGASGYLRDMLIDKDSMDTCAITFPDVSVFHMKQILALVYCGKTLIDKGDEAIVFSVMKCLGFPVNDLLCRTAKEQDAKQVTVLRHIVPSQHCEEKDTDTVDNDVKDCEQLEEDIAIGIIQDDGNQAVDERDEEVVMQEENHDEESSATNSVVEDQDLETFRCPKCASLQLTELELYCHFQISENCSRGVLQWIGYADGKCLKCQYDAPVGTTLLSLFEHVSSCVGKISDSHFKEETNQEDNLLTDLPTSSSHSVYPPVDHSIIKKERDKGIDLTCNGLENQAALQEQLSKKKGRKRNMRHKPDDGDNKSVSSINSSSSSSKTVKRRKLSGGSSSALSSISSDSLGQFTRGLEPVSLSYPDADRDIIHTEFGLTSLADIRQLRNEDLLILFHRCPLCKWTYKKMNRATKCLRQHGYRICWVCLKLLPVVGPEFDEHSHIEDAETSGGKVTCALCSKKLDFKIGLPAHIGNFHYQRVLSATEKSSKCSTENQSSSSASFKSDTVEEQSDLSHNKNCDDILNAVQSTPNHEMSELIPTEGEGKIKGNADAENCTIMSNSQKTNESASVYGATDVPPDIASSMAELSVKVKSCQVCNSTYHISETATKCLKSHGYKRCWACIKAFPVGEISQHVEEIHALPGGSPNMVKCFLCLNSYAYDKGLNLHVGKHLAEYERRIGIRSVEGKKKSNVEKMNSIEVKVGEEQTPEVLVRRQSPRRKLVVSSIRRRAKMKNKKGFVPAKKSIVVRTKRRKTRSSKLNDEVEQSNKQSKNTLEASDVVVNSNLLQDNCGDDDVIKTESENQPRRPSTTVTSAMSRVFLEVKEISGEKYNIYGLMDPIKGVQSGKTIAILVSSDQASNVKSSKQELV